MPKQYSDYYLPLLEKHRLAASLTRTQLSEKALGRKDARIINQWENQKKRASMKSIQLLTQALGCQPEDLTGCDTTMRAKLEAAGKRIVERRKLLKYTQAHVARVCGLSFDRMHRTEQGQGLTLELLKDLSGALDCTVGFLAGDIPLEFFELEGRRIEAKKKARLQGQANMCFECQHAYAGGCPWVTRFEPVNGWTVSITQKSTNETTKIVYCPEFKAGKIPKVL